MKNDIEPKFKVLIESLDNRNVLDKTVFIFMSDHGHISIKHDEAYCINDKKMNQIIKPTFTNPYFYGAKNFDCFAGLNGGMAQIYFKYSDDWKRPDEYETIGECNSAKQRLFAILESIDESRMSEDGELENAVSFVLVRDYWNPNPNDGEERNAPYRVYNGEMDENGLPILKSLESLVDDELWNEYVQPIERVRKFHHENRSGDIVLIANTKDGYYFDHLLQYSTHGSLLPNDSWLPFVIAGIPIVEDSRINRINIDNPEGISLVDIAPTIFKILGLTVPIHFDGLPRLEVNIN